VAGHIGLEPANPSASYLIGFAWQLPPSSAQAGLRRRFAFQLHDTDLQLAPDAIDGRWPKQPMRIGARSEH
jgi:hypothetical protein